MGDMMKIKAELSESAGLTPEVGRVFELKAVGFSGKHVARLLHKSIKTVDAQTGTYLQALGVENTQQAIAKAAAEGWLTFKYVARCLVMAVTLPGLLPYGSDDRQPMGRPRPAAVRAVRFARRESA